MCLLMNLEKHKVLQILVNLIRNAELMLATTRLRADKRLTDARGPVVMAMVKNIGGG